MIRAENLKCLRYFRTLEVKPDPTVPHTWLQPQKVEFRGAPFSWVRSAPGGGGVHTHKKKKKRDAAEKIRRSTADGRRGLNCSGKTLRLAP